MKSFLAAFLLIFVAELGDKTQFMTLAMSSRYKATTVLLGVTVGTMAISLVSVLLGSVIGKALPANLMNILAGLIFIVFGIQALRQYKADEATDKDTPKKIRGFVWLTIAITFFIAELADKTMLATIAIASRDKHYFAVWLGSTLGLVTSNALAIIAGKALSKYLTGKVIHYGSAAIYIIAGIFAIRQGLISP